MLNDRVINNRVVKNLGLRLGDCKADDALSKVANGNAQTIVSVPAIAFASQMGGPGCLLEEAKVRPRAPLPMLRMSPSNRHLLLRLLLQHMAQRDRSHRATVAQMASF